MELRRPHPFQGNVCVAYNLSGVGESRFIRIGHSGSFWQRVCGNLFAWYAARTAPQCTPCENSFWNVTNQNVTSHADSGQTAHVTTPLMHLFQLMTSLNGNIFRIPWPLWGESTDSPHKGMWRVALVFSCLDVFCAWSNGWVNNPDAGDLRCHRAHYDTTVMVNACLSLGIF